MAEKDSHGHRIRHRMDEIINVRREATRGGPLSGAIDRIGRYLAHPILFVLLTVFHVGWLVWNSGWLPLPVFDPSPFPVLAMIASVEAPFFSVLILSYQRRQQRIAELREEVEVSIALHAEAEASKLLALVADIHEAMKLDPSKRGADLDYMMSPLEPDERIRQIKRELDSDGV